MDEMWARIVALEENNKFLQQELNITNNRLKVSEDTIKSYKRLLDYKQEEIEGLNAIIRDVNLIKVCELLRQR